MQSNPASVVADADVLAADVLIGDSSRRALDHLRAHSWSTLIASEPLLDDAMAVIEAFTEEALARAWRNRVEEWALLVDHPAADHPALGAANAGTAGHVLTLDPTLSSAKTNVSLKRWMNVSVRSPEAFASLFDPASLYPTVVGGEYPGPDRDPRR